MFKANQRAKQILDIWKLHLQCRTGGVRKNVIFKMGRIQLLVTEDVALTGSPRIINVDLSIFLAPRPISYINGVWCNAIIHQKF